MVTAHKALLLCVLEDEHGSATREPSDRPFEPSRDRAVIGSENGAPHGLGGARDQRRPTPEGDTKLKAGLGGGPPFILPMTALAGGRPEGPLSALAPVSASDPSLTFKTHRYEIHECTKAASRQLPSVCLR
jgi:hypothetical protein